MAKSQVGRYTLSRPMVGGIPQALITPDDRPDLPLALVLHGGPGEPMTPFIGEAPELEERFVLCYWEQRGAGMSYSKDIPAQSMNVEQFVEDALEVARLLLEKYGRKKMYLFGFSWGSLLGVLTVQKAPELFYAYMGVGQIANQLQSEQQAFDLVLERAQQKGDDKSVKVLQKVGRPPYPKETVMKSIGTGRKIFRLYDQTPGKKLSLSKYVRKIFSCPFYNFKDKRNYFKGMMSGGDLFLQVLSVDLIKSVPKLEIPIFVINGEHDLQTMPKMAQQYVDALSAPVKEFCLFEDAGHSAHSHQPKLFAHAIERMVQAGELANKG